LSPRFGSGQEFRVVAARSGDHHTIHGLLVSLLHHPSAIEFQAQQEDPFYEPTDRLLVKRGDQIVAHVRLVHREMRFGQLVVPISILSDFVVLPEYTGEGCEAELLSAAERVMASGKTELALVRTQVPALFLRQGWTKGPRHSYSVAGTREILSTLHQQRASTANPLARDAIPLNIRMWRHVEQAALMRLYGQHTQSSYGPLVRTEAYWRWLISRRAYDQIYVAIEGPDRLGLDDSLSPIVGYAVMSNDRILELVPAPGHAEAGLQLLARACGDAIEQDLNYLRLDAAPDDPLHKLLVLSGGRTCHHELDGGQVLMSKLLHPTSFLRARLSAIHQSAKEHGAELPADLGLLVGPERWCLSVRQRGIRLQEGKLGRSYLECPPADLTQLLLGQLDVRAAVEAGRLTASTRVAAETANACFPQLPLWRPPLDEQPA